MGQPHSWTAIAAFELVVVAGIVALHLRLQDSVVFTEFKATTGWIQMS
jgi:hypothetical protein